MYVDVRQIYVAARQMCVGTAKKKSSIVTINVGKDSARLIAVRR
jgi:hypothetical protein